VLDDGDDGDAGTRVAAAWRTLFAKLPLRKRLDETGVAEITARQIKELTREEPRLMTKFDTRESRPTMLKDLTVLAVRNGTYWLLAGEGYEDLPRTCPRAQFALRGEQLETLPRDCRTESQVLDLAHIYGVLEHFLGEERVWLTSRGRRRSRRFGFRFHTTHRVQDVCADGVQVEVDGGYEGDRVYVAEAKLGLRTHFHVRQLYYPYQLWLAEEIGKEVCPLFVSYSNRELQVYEYRFRADAEYHSIVLARSAAYALDPAEALPSVASVLRRTRLVPEPVDVPFPQADSVERVLDVVAHVAGNIATRAEITLANDFAPRQATYYTDAARYLGLITRDGPRFVLTREGEQLIAGTRSARFRLLASHMASRPALRAVFERLRAGEGAPAVMRALRKARPELSAATLVRRMQTAARWLAWLHEVFDGVRPRDAPYTT
jgi:hypothetical protein